MVYKRHQVVIHLCYLKREYQIHDRISHCDLFELASGDKTPGEKQCVIVEQVFRNKEENSHGTRSRVVDSAWN